MRLDKGSSPLFLVALVTFEDHDEAQACDDAIRDLRPRLSLRGDFEFHFAQNSRRVRQAFLSTVSEFGFSYHVFGLNKAKVTSAPGFQYKDSLYKWTARMTFENAKPHLDDAIIVLDGCGDREFRKTFSAYLRKRLNDKHGPRRIREVKIQPSHTNNLLQLADYVASISAGALRAKPESVEFRRLHLATHELTHRVWPW